MKIRKGNMDKIQNGINKTNLNTIITPEMSANNQIQGFLGSGIQPEDVVDFSSDLKESVNDFQSKLDEMRNRCQMLREGLQQAREAGEGMAKAWKEKLICLQIAMRIMAGDNVPVEDKRYLAEKDLELYIRAISLRQIKKDPKDYDRLSEDDEKDSNDNTDACAESNSESVVTEN